MKEPTNVQIKYKQDLANLRQVTREYLQDMGAPLIVQSQITWVANYLAQQMRYFALTGEVTLSQIQAKDHSGLQIICDATWLQGMHSFYFNHLKQVLTRWNNVEFVHRDDDYLVVVAWIDSQS